MKLTSLKAGFWVIGTLLMLGYMPSAFAKVEVKLVEPQKFHDYEISNYTKKKSRELLQKHFSRLFAKVSKDFIQESDVLMVDITDIDLAGYMEYFYGNMQRNVRIVKDNTRFRIKFDYKLTNAAGETLKEGKGEIRDFLDHRPVRAELKHKEYQSISYMHDPVLDWMKETFTAPN